MKLPESLKETIKMLREELADLQVVEDRRIAERLLGWLDELYGLRSDEVIALENAVEALKRIADGIEMKEASSDADKHYANRINKLVNNIQEVVQLERKRREPQDHTKHKRRTPNG